MPCDCKGIIVFACRGRILNSRKVDVSELRVGMFVSRLDKDWLETPFLIQGFHIEEEDDIDAVAEHCKFVWVDDDKVFKVKAGEHSSGVSEVLKVPIDSNIFVPEVPLKEEHSRILNVFKQARVTTKNLLNQFQHGGVVDTDVATETVSNCVDSVIRHPDALLWMSKMRNENEYTAEHCLNVCILAIAFGRQLNMSKEELSQLGMCALLHDVGKMKVSPEILNKPGKLTAREMRLMTTHTTHGRNLLMASSGIPDIVIQVAYSHHERMDGHGYPRNLKGEDISKFARIVALVDAYDAMTADRCYQQGKTSTEAMRVIYEERGTHFDEDLALKFIRSLGLYPVGSIAELHSGEVGIVVETNPHYRQLPRVHLMRDKNKQPFEKAILIDLSLTESGELSNDYLVKKVWKDKSFGLSVNSFLEHGLAL